MRRWNKFRKFVLYGSVVEPVLASSSRNLRMRIPIGQLLRCAFLPEYSLARQRAILRTAAVSGAGRLSTGISRAHTGAGQRVNSDAGCFAVHVRVAAHRGVGVPGAARLCLTTNSGVTQVRQNVKRAEAVFQQKELGNLTSGRELSGIDFVRLQRRAQRKARASPSLASRVPRSPRRSARPRRPAGATDDRGSAPRFPRRV